MLSKVISTVISLFVCLSLSLFSRLTKAELQRYQVSIRQDTDDQSVATSCSQSILIFGKHAKVKPILLVSLWTRVNVTQDVRFCGSCQYLAKACVGILIPLYQVAADLVALLALSYPTVSFAQVVPQTNVFDNYTTW